MSILRDMTEALSVLLLATAFFVGSHFVLASLSVRKALQAQIGENGHRGLFSLVAIIGLTWTGFSYGAATYDNVYLWDWSPALSMVPVAVMPLTCILFVCAITTRSPTSVGGEKLASDPHPAGGVLTVTRHPMMFGFALWAASHIVPNGDMASLILFGGILVLTVGGMLHIDHRRRNTLGSEWGPIALTTSTVPFLAAIQGRTKVDWAGIGLWRVAAALALYAALAFGHEWIVGVVILPA